MKLGQTIPIVLILATAFIFSACAHRVRAFNSFPELKLTPIVANLTVGDEQIFTATGGTGEYYFEYDGSVYAKPFVLEWQKVSENQFKLKVTGFNRNAMFFDRRSGELKGYYYEPSYFMVLLKYRLKNEIVGTYSDVFLHLPEDIPENKIRRLPGK